MSDALIINARIIHFETCKIGYVCKSARVMPGATHKRGQADRQRFMLLFVDAICGRYGECHVHALHTCGRSKSVCQAKPTYLVPDVW